MPYGTWRGDTAKVTQQSSDKTALLNELKLDRSTAATSNVRPTKWFLMLALVAGVGLMFFFFGLPGAGQVVAVNSAIARAPSAQPLGSSVLDATGYVVARRQATVSSKATGKVVEVFIEEGLVVSEGQLLATLDDSIPRAQFELAESQLRSSEAGLDELHISIQQAQLDFNRTDGLAKRNLASQAELDRADLSVQALMARLARARKDIVVAQRGMAVQSRILDDMQIRAPFAGVVIAKSAQPGEMISPVSAGGGFTRTGICTIVDMDSLEIEVDVNESYINRVQAKQPVQVTLNAYPDYHIPAQVIAIIPTADRTKATVRVRIELLEKDQRVFPDMGVRVAFLNEQIQVAPIDAPQGVLIPSEGISRDAEGNFVLVIRNDVVSRRAIRVGEAEGGRTRVLTGLANGERIVARLSQDVLEVLAEGQTVTVTN
ncbi:MAG: efflux RND transporter periplasmic adaptor subunit [Gammaproteobacteria bacterium]|nr:efflux RND transporter periplasmic adaptor subunit [Gammaproteobacteria bacterium]